MEYLFMYDTNKGWWLKLDSEEKLLDYFEKTKDSFMREPLDLYMELHNRGFENKLSVTEVLASMPPEERFEIMVKDLRVFNIMYGAVMQAEKVNGTIFDGFRAMNIERGFKCLQDIRQYGQVYINSVGGSTFLLDCTQFCRRKELVFPDFRQEDIRIKQFKGGTHFYAFVGDMQVRDGENMKWNTYKQAHQAALSILESS